MSLQTSNGVQISVAVNLKVKEVDDVLGGEDAWKNVQKTEGDAIYIFFAFSKKINKNLLNT